VDTVREGGKEEDGVSAAVGGRRLGTKKSNSTPLPVKGFPTVTWGKCDEDYFNPGPERQPGKHTVKSEMEKRTDYYEKGGKPGGGGGQQYVNYHPK